jgi:ribosome maturation protein SDO1
MKEAKVSIDPYKSANEQVEQVVSKLNMLLPIKFSTIKIEVTISADQASRCYGMLKQYGLKGERWLSDGSLDATLEFPAGLQGEFFERLNNMTHGTAVTKMVN